MAPVDHVRLERPIVSQVSSTPHEDQTCQPLPQYSVCPTAVSFHPPHLQPSLPQSLQLCTKMFLHFILSISTCRGSQSFCLSFSAFVLSFQSVALLSFLFLKTPSHNTFLRQQTHTTSFSVTVPHRASPIQQPTPVLVQCWNVSPSPSTASFLLLLLNWAARAFFLFSSQWPGLSGGQWIKLLNTPSSLLTFLLKHFLQTGLSEDRKFF